MQMFDLITVGDAVVDLFIYLSDSGQHYHMEKEKKELALVLGEKIPIDSSSFLLGGNATHVAIGLSRLGFRVGFIAELGDDIFAEKILRDLEKEKVGKSLLKQTPHSDSAFSVSLNIGGERTLFVKHGERDHNLSLDGVQAQWIFLSSMGEKWEAMYKKTLEFVKSTNTRLAFNPGSMQLKKGVDSFIDVIKVCDILFVNKEEAEEILYKKILPSEQKENPESLLFRLQRMGPKMAVITDGENGSYVIDEDSKVSAQKIFHVSVTEKTGAGDAFAAGFLAAIMSGENAATALLWGTAESAAVITKIGGQEGLLTKQELRRRIEENQ